ncbi:MAG TPA: acyl-CoA dehydrogenase family protein [Acidimicrobiales bacterium]|nr:acyl-CoA dehydrogenase family protein [Acidimicrobiales bacterium]
MDFQLTALQEELRDTTRKLCAGRFPVAASRASGGRVDAAAWRDLGEAGVFTLRLPEERAGLGLGCTDAAVVFEELGRALVPGPLVWTEVTAAWGVVPERAAGVVGGVERATPATVEHLGDLDVLVVLDDEGAWAVDPTAVGASELPPFDPLTPVWRVDTLPRGERVAPSAAARRARLEGATLAAAQLAGLASGVCELTVAYTRQRHQFGRPVGSFQAVKHALADMLVRAEMARVQAYAAAAHLDEPALGDPSRAVAAAKVIAGDAARANGRASVQLHGGMGMTWEVDAHLYLKRAVVLDRAFGSSGAHALSLARGL